MLEMGMPPLPIGPGVLVAGAIALAEGWPGVAVGPGGGVAVAAGPGMGVLVGTGGFVGALVAVTMMTVGT